MQCLNIEDAYAIQRRFADISPNICGWKIGGSNTFTQHLFNVAEPYFGFLTECQMFGCGHRSTAGLELDTFEVEICVVIPDAYDHSIEYSLKDIQTWEARIGLEFPKTRISDLGKKGVAHLIADNCAAGALFVSNTTILLDGKHSLDIQINGVDVIERLDLAASIEKIIEQFLKLNRKFGFVVCSGHIVATGGLTKLITLNKGQTISIKKDSATVLEFSR